MEITKIFSELDGEERLYSVLLDETEMALFSEFQKEFNSKAQKELRHRFDMSNGMKAKGQDHFLDTSTISRARNAEDKQYIHDKYHKMIDKAKRRKEEIDYRQDKIREMENLSWDKKQNMIDNLEPGYRKARRITDRVNNDRYYNRGAKEAALKSIGRNTLQKEIEEAERKKLYERQMRLAQLKKINHCIKRRPDL